MRMWVTSLVCLACCALLLRIVNAVHRERYGNLVDLIHDGHVANVRVLTGGLEHLPSLLEELDGSKLLRKIHIEAFSSGDDAVLAKDLGEAVDGFVGPAPWWVIAQETYNRFQSEMATALSHAVVLLRFPAPYELHLRRLAAVQYPPSQAICAQSPLQIGRMINSGWGSQILFAFHMQNSPYSVFNVWYSNNNDPGESMQVCHARDCAPGLVNKWECVFLPLTNCSLADVAFTKCHTPGFPKKATCFPMDFFAVSNMSSDGGQMHEWDQELGKHPSNAYQQRINERFPLPGSEPDGTDTGGDGEDTGNIPNSRFVYAQDLVTIRPVSREVNFFLFGSIFRPNYNLRSRVRIRVDDLMRSHQIPFRVGQDKCVAIHIRRGDRMIDTTVGNSHQRSITMPEYCRVLTANYSIGRLNCTQEALDAVTKHWAYGSQDCQGLSDFGCWDARTFGELTLLDYLHKAHVLLPSITNAFVMSDDGPWLQRQIAALPTLQGKSTHYVSDYSVGMLPAESNARADGKNGTKYSVDFWASVAVARHCQGFVGHFSSGLAHFVYNAMCFHHGHHTAQCPPGADIGNFGP